MIPKKDMSRILSQNCIPSVSSFNWERGSWSDISRKAEATICIAGDWAPIRAFQSIIENDPESIYGDLLPVIRSSDLSVVNLEAPLSDCGTPACKSGAVFKGERKHVNGLSAVPFDVVTLANNHMFDFGLEAFKETIEALDQTGIRHLGAGMNREEAGLPLVVELKGIKVGIVNFSEGEDLTSATSDPGVMGWELEYMTHTIRDLKKKVDFVLVISHCGIEYVPFPPPYVADAFKDMADAGADLVIGHHPHVPQGISFHNSTPVCHSLGNFVFFQETDLKFRKLGYMVRIGLNRDSLASIEIVPYQILPQGVELLKDEQAALFFEKFKEISLPVNDPKALEESWHGFLDYYGQKGFFNEISMIMEKLENDTQKGAAMFRNRLTTLQHYNHWKDFMTRIIKGDLGTSPSWAQDLAKEWFTATIDQQTDK